MERHAPKTIMTLHGVRPVLRYISHPPGQHPPGCPLVADCTAVEMITDAGSRWQGCEQAVICSSLEMHLIGLNPRNELTRAWPKPGGCKTGK